MTPVLFVAFSVLYFVVNKQDFVTIYFNGKKNMTIFIKPVRVTIINWKIADNSFIFPRLHIIVANPNCQRHPIFHAYFFIRRMNQRNLSFRQLNKFGFIAGIRYIRYNRVAPRSTIIQRFAAPKAAGAIHP